MRFRFAMALFGLFAFSLPASAKLSISEIGQATQWQKVEFQITGTPSASSPFDSDKIAIDATIKSPSGSTQVVPAFWFQDYTRTQKDGAEVLTPSGSPGWRLRYLPTQSGIYAVTVNVTVNKVQSGSVSTTFKVLPTNPSGPKGFPTKSANNQSFQTTHGETLPLVGADTCWYDTGGTYDYDNWFGKMTANGENFTRIWMCPWAFGLEDTAGTLTNYPTDSAWRLDYVFDLAEKDGIYIQLCLDYHGMFAVLPDSWGGNNYWPVNPYNSANGGMCATQDDFFTSPMAQATYEKRLRYLIGRYGYSSHLFSWEFFNELDNVYAYLNGSDVASWFSSTGAWLKSADPYKHLVTTSYVNTNHPEVWDLPQIDIVEMHPYGWSDPAASISSSASALQTQYSKPLIVAEFGTSTSGWGSTVDPYLRGFRQGVWGAAVGGTAGTAMSWWWENLYSGNVDPEIGAVHKALGNTGWQTGTSQAVTTYNADFSNSLGPLVKNGKPFSGQIAASPTWFGANPGTLTLANASYASQGPTQLNGFVQGAYHASNVLPFQVLCWFGNSGVFTMHLNKVAAAGAILNVSIDGESVLTKTFPSSNASQNTVYDDDISISVPAGKHLIAIQNLGLDWFLLDWVSVADALPATYLGGVEAIGTRTSSDSLVYVINPAISWPKNALTESIAPLSGSLLTLTNWPAGTYTAIWYSTTSGVPVSTSSAKVSGGNLIFTVPTFTDDLLVRILKQ